MSDPIQWQVIITPTVKKRLSRLNRQDREKVIRALIALKNDPFSQDVKSLKGRPEWRLRVGQWRVILRIDSGNLVIVAVSFGSRGDIYKR